MDSDIKDRIEEAVDDSFNEFVRDFKRGLTSTIESIIDDTPLDELHTKKDLEEWAKDNGFEKKED